MQHISQPKFIAEKLKQKKPKMLALLFKFKQFDKAFSTFSVLLINIVLVDKMANPFI